MQTWEEVIKNEKEQEYYKKLEEEIDKRYVD